MRVLRTMKGARVSSDDSNTSFETHVKIHRAFNTLGHIWYACVWKRDKSISIIIIHCGSNE